LSKIGNFTVNFTHFRHFWAILSILVGKIITDLNGFEKKSSRKWVKFIKTFICAQNFEIQVPKACTLVNVSEILLRNGFHGLKNGFIVFIGYDLVLYDLS
jgi:hypothetical protein